MSDKCNKQSQFFAIQAYRKRLSWLFFGLFSLVVFFHLLMLFLVAIITSIMIDFAYISFWLLLSVLFLVLLIFGAIIRTQNLNNSGQVLALKMGGVRLFINNQPNNNEYVSKDLYTINKKTNQPNNQHNNQKLAFYRNFIKADSLSDLPSGYRRFYEFCEQISIASGTTMPMLYVLPHELGVNACVAGQDRDLALIITQGAVDKLSNEQLYALIAHEFGHILHGDAKFNLRLSAMMAGLSLIYESAEWLESKLLGEFDSNYHRFDPTSLALNNGNKIKFNYSQRFNNPHDWLNVVTLKEQKTYISQLSYEIGQVAYVSKLFIIGFLLIYRLIGVFGMMTHEWLCQKFNHQRELLADATCVQLTRSYAIVDLLKDMTYKFDSRLYSTQVASIGFFFFADPADKSNRFFSSHPAYDERIYAIDHNLFLEFGEQVCINFNIDKLQTALKTATNHQKIIPIEEEIVQIDYFDKAFEGGFETIIDGRLITDKAFKDGFLENNNNNIVNFDINYQQSLDDFDPKKLPWQITKNLRNPLGIIAVIECVILCQSVNKLQKILAKYKHDSTIQVALNQIFDDNISDNIIFNHHIDKILLVDVAKIAVNHRYFLLIHSLQVLQYRLDKPIHKDSKIDNMLGQYCQDILRLIIYNTTPAKDIFNKHYINKQYQKFIYANIILKIISTLSKYTNTQEKLADSFIQYSYQKNYNTALYDILLKENQQTKICFVTLFLVSVQGEYFLLREFDELLDLTYRALRLMGICHVFCVDDIMMIQGITIYDLVWLLLSIKSDNVPIVVVKTWQTVLHYDSIISDNERVIETILDMNFNEK